MNDVIDVNPKNGRFQIEKRPNGYFICTRFYGSNQSVETKDCQQIWDSSTKLFLKPIYENNINYSTNEDQSIPTRFSNLWTNRHQIFPLIYYGYPSWTKDTKAFLEKKPDLTAKELETLARVYYEEANNYIHPGQYGLGGEVGLPFEDAGYSKLSPERVESFKTSYDNGLLTWERIKENNPLYKPNLITNLSTKIGNEYMHGYFTLNCIHEPELAKEYLNKATYPESVIIKAKSLLDECEQNSILLTNGDSDTYPLWYVQDKLGFRNDVIIINLSLAQTSWYLEYLIDRYELKSTFSTQELQYNENKYFIFQDTTKIDFKEWVKSYKSSLKKNKINNENYVLVNGNWEIPMMSGSYSLQIKKYVHAYQVFVYDIIANNSSRPFFAITPYSFMELGLLDYFVYTGHLSKLEAKQQSNSVTEEAELKIINSINSLPEGYFDGFGNSSAQERSTILYDANLVSINKTNKIVSVVEKHLLSELPIEITTPKLANSIVAFYGKFDITKQKNYKLRYDKTAIEFVEGFSILPNSLYDDLDELYSIVSIYTSTPSNKLTSETTEIIIWEGSEKLYNNLIKKLSTVAKTCKVENLKVSFNKVDELQRFLSLCELN
jgi:hypothetical protein